MQLKPFLFGIVYSFLAFARKLLLMPFSIQSVGGCLGFLLSHQFLSVSPFSLPFVAYVLKALMNSVMTLTKFAAVVADQGGDEQMFQVRMLVFLKQTSLIHPFREYLLHEFIKNPQRKILI